MRVSRGYRIVPPLRYGARHRFAFYPGLTPWATFLPRLPALFDVSRCILIAPCFGFLQPLRVGADTNLFPGCVNAGTAERAGHPHAIFTAVTPARSISQTPSKSTK